MFRRVFVSTALLLAVAGPGRASDSPSSDQAQLRQLNNDYVSAYLTSDLGRFRAILADDFVGVLADGRVITKADFLRQAKQPPDAHGLRLHDVLVRTYGDTGLVGAYVTYKRADGSAVRTRYTAFFVRREGQWAVVWVQWTRASLAN